MFRMSGQDTKIPTYLGQGCVAAPHGGTHAPRSIVGDPDAALQDAQREAWVRLTRNPQPEVGLDGLYLGEFALKVRQEFDGEVRVLEEDPGTDGDACASGGASAHE
jgi:hypothetical protein